MITIEQLRELLDYDSDAGELLWRPRPREMFTRDRLWMTWNTRYAGKRALNTIDSHGYAHGRLLDKKHYAHRVILALTNGEWPDEVDHINGDRTDNRLSNLRAVSHQRNMRNLKRATNNTSGVTGVYWSHRDKKWCAQIVVEGRRKMSLGQYVAKADAVEARKRASELLGYHENHGRAVL